MCRWHRSQLSVLVCCSERCPTIRAWQARCRTNRRPSRLALRAPGSAGWRKTCRSQECAELFSLSSSLSSGRKHFWFSNLRNRDGISTRRLNVGVFTRPRPIADNRLPLGGEAPPARPRRSSISPNGQNQAVKETPEQIVAQLDGGAARANECANEKDGAPPAAYCCDLL